MGFFAKAIAINLEENWLNIKQDFFQVAMETHQQTHLPVELLFVFHPHVLSKWIIIVMRVAVYYHIVIDNAWTSTSATWIFHGCAFELKPEKKG